MSRSLELHWLKTTIDESTAAPEKTSAPVAYVYVSRPTHVDGFAASSSGKLTPVPGSPIAGTAVGRMSVTKKYLFGRSGHGKLIQAFSINSKGSLEKAGSILAYKYLPEDCLDFAMMQVDASGSTLYGQEDTNCQVTNSAYVSSTAIGGLWFCLQCCAGVRPISAGDGGFHLRTDAIAVPACSLHRSAFTPITRSHRNTDASPMRPQARL